MSAVRKPDQVSQLQAEIEQLRGEIRMLRQELALQVDGAQIGRLQLTLGVWPKAAHLMLILYARAGQPVTRWGIVERLFPDEDQTRSYSYISVLVCHARKRLGAEAILSRFGSGAGYALSAEGMAKISAALAEPWAA